MIPEDKKSAVERALQTAFGVTAFESIREMTAGLSSALIFRIEVLGKAYLLRIITRTDAMADPTKHFACMQAGSEAGLAPRVWYASVEDRISITDFIEAKPFPMNEAKVLLSGMIRRLHALPPFPFRINYLDVMDGLVTRFKNAKMLPESDTAGMFKQYERIKSVYPRNNEDLVACHNDLKPDNIIFDGERAWFVDWESAFLNNRYSELAMVANFVVKNDDDEKEYLGIYFGGEVTEYQRARFFLMRQLMHVFYTASFFMFATGVPIDMDAARPGFRELHDQLWTGAISMAPDANKHLYARVHLEQFLQNVQLQRFEDAQRIIAGYQVV